MLTLDCTHSFENNNATASCYIRYQRVKDFIYELDISADRTPVFYVASCLHAQIISNYLK